MSFDVTIKNHPHPSGHYFRLVEVELVCVGPGAPDESTPFLFDTAASFTLVSEDIAQVLRLPAHGESISIRGIGGRVEGQLVPVAFRFTKEPNLSLIVKTHWVILPPGTTGIKILALRDVLPTYWLGMKGSELRFGDLP